MALGWTVWLIGANIFLGGFIFLPFQHKDASKALYSY
uniref:Uncharacterized protein n=1 Tax=Rhizophora mucronata TaxID=61149 RepID=A0A2P2PV06_RHIMU